MNAIEILTEAIPSIKATGESLARHGQVTTTDGRTYQVEAFNAYQVDGETFECTCGYANCEHAVAVAALQLDRY